MIIPKYKIIFIHIPKVAGQSIEQYFMNDMKIQKIHAREYLLGNNLNLDEGPPKLAHLSIKEMVEYNYVEKGIVNSYFKFAFVRNPWSRVVSFYKFLGYQNYISFDDFLVKYFSKKIWSSSRYWFIKPQVDFLKDDQGNINMDFIGRFETIKDDFLKLQDNLNLPKDALPFVNKSKTSIQKKYHTLRRDPELVFRIFGKGEYYKKYQDYYSKSTKGLVEDLYGIDIDTFNYTFDE